MEAFLHWEALAALMQVIIIDLSLAADNAIVIGLIAARLPAKKRKKIILLGIIAATVLRVIFASVVTYLLEFIGLLFAGGLLLAWVAWKMWREIRLQSHQKHLILDPVQPKTEREAILQIVLADIAMSLDNVLAVAGAAREHVWILLFGLALSMLLMAITSTWLARILQKYRWLAYVGLLIVFYVALKMIWDGGADIYFHFIMPPPAQPDAIELTIGF